MSKLQLAKLVKTVQVKTAKHMPEILTGFGIAIGVVSTISAVKATPKALELLAEAEAEKGEELTVKEKIKVAWKPYVPAIAAGFTSAACLIGATAVGKKRITALATAYKLSETALAEYKDKVIETIGEKEEKVIREKIAKDKVDNTEPAKKEVIIVEGGDVRCLDVVSGRFFSSSREKIRAAVNELNRRMLCDIGGYVSLNEFYDELGLDHTRQGDDLGWRVDLGMIEIEFDAGIADDGIPYIVLDYAVAPQYDYSKSH